MKLTFESFFSHLILHPLEADTKKDKNKALVASIACGIFTLGICHAVCAVKKYFKAKVADQPHDLKQRFARLRNSIFKTEEKTDPVYNFFKTITPNNIDQLLNVYREFCLDEDLNVYQKFYHGEDEDVEKWSFGIKRRVYPQKSFLGEPLVGKPDLICYFCTLVCGENELVSLSLELHNGKFKCHHNGTSDTFHYFDNLDEVLRYLIKGNFYNGEYYKADYYLITKLDNKVIKYPNPFKI